MLTQRLIKGNRLSGSGIGIMIILITIFSISFPARGEEPYNLGAIFEFTGYGAVYSKHSFQGVELAVEEINSQGGFLGKHPIKLFSRDSQTKPDIGIREARDLILREKVKAIIGTQSSHIGLAVEEVCYENKTLQIAANSNSEAFTVANYSPYTYHMVPNTYMQAKAMGVYITKIAKEKGWKTYVTIGSDFEFSHMTIDTVVEYLKKALPELRLIKQYWPKVGESEFSSYITSIMVDNPDFVYAAVPGLDGFAFMRQGNNYGFFKKFNFASAAIFLTELMEMKDEVPRGVMGIFRAPFMAHLDNPMMANVVKKYRAKYGQYPDDWVPLQYDAVYALKQGIEKAGSIDTEKVKNALKGMTVNTTRGKLYFRKIDNMLNCPSYVGIVADDPGYPFPILKNIMTVTGEETWRPESEIPLIRDKAGLGKKRNPEDLKF